MKRLRFLWVSVLGSVLLLTPQTTRAGWTRTYGGGNYDAGRCVQQAVDGSYIVTGYTWSFGIGGSSDLWLLKIDESGDTLWTKTYGKEKYDEGHFVQLTFDGGYIITGYIEEPTSLGHETWLLKTDSKGDTLWTKTYGGESSTGNCVQQTIDDGYIVVGYTWSSGAGACDVWLLKTDSLGDTLWTRTYGGEGGDWGSYVQQTHDEGFVIVGSTFSFGSGWNDVWLIKTDSLGDTLWTKTYGSPWMDRGECVQETSDGGYIITGGVSQDSLDWGFPIALWLLKTDSVGDTIWTRSYGGGKGVNNIEWGYCVRETTDGGYVVSGEKGSYPRGLWLLKTDSEGDTLWTRLYGEGYNDIGYCVQQTDDGGYIITGSTESFGVGESDLWLIKTNANGDTLAIAEEPTGNPREDWDIVTSVGQQIVLRYADGPDGFHASIFDATGRKVDELHATGASGMITWGKCYGPGVYFIREESGYRGTLQKVVLIR